MADSSDCLTVEERLAQVRERLKQARGDNLAALEEDGREVRLRPGEGELKRPRKRMRKQTKLEKLIDDEYDSDIDPVLRSLNARAARLEPTETNGNTSVPEVYGGTTANVTTEQSERLAKDVAETEARRKKFNRRRTFVGDRADISFINEGNRAYNRVLSKHFDKFEDVRKTKESLERGTALD